MTNFYDELIYKISSQIDNLEKDIKQVLINQNKFNEFQKPIKPNIELVELEAIVLLTKIFQEYEIGRPRRQWRELMEEVEKFLKE